MFAQRLPLIPHVEYKDLFRSLSWLTDQLTVSVRFFDCMFYHLVGDDWQPTTTAAATASSSNKSNDNSTFYATVVVDVVVAIVIAAVAAVVAAVVTAVVAAVVAAVVVVACDDCCDTICATAFGACVSARKLKPRLRATVAVVAVVAC